MAEWTMPGGSVLHNVHPPQACEGDTCVIHNPLTEHPMSAWPLIWRDDRGIFERLCPHGVGHPAPEQDRHLGRLGSVHGCDGCCR